MELVRFGDKLASKDPTSSPFRIKASDLDRNFAMLKPLHATGNSRQYLLSETPDGWTMKIFPDFPSGTGPFFLGINNGQLFWSGSGVNDSDGSPVLGIVEVERCDGKKMKLLGTEWY